MTTTKNHALPSISLTFWQKDASNETQLLSPVSDSAWRTGEKHRKLALIEVSLKIFRDIFSSLAN
jgi:hypothetical protein